MSKRYAFVSTVLIAILVYWALPAFAGVIVDAAWVRIYNGPANSNDEAQAIAVDRSGNVYVTGQSLGNGTDWDYATIKYYPDADTAWVRRYNGPSDGPDVAVAIAMDGSGNVHVTGHSRGGRGNTDYLTIKYYANGDTAWVRRYNGPTDSTDEVTDIAIDSSGNVYVTGYSPGIGSAYDYTTVKYNPDGDEVRVVRYNGPGNSGDKAYAIAVDNRGNVYVSGASQGTTTGSDYATVKYDQDGNEVWVRRYDGPEGGADAAYDMELDDSANVYVTGSCYDSDAYTKYATVKYDSSGTELWARTYKNELTISPGGTALDIAADDLGNAWVTGWMRNSGTLFDYATVKYDPEGNQLWAARYHSWRDGCDGAEAIGLDGLGNVYVTGWSDDVDLIADDFATVKYDPSGNQLWVARYNGAANSQDIARAIAVDDSAYIYVTGEATGAQTGYEYVTIKYMQIEGQRGDANGDDEIGLSDVVYLINYVFRDGLPPDPIQAGDANCDAKVDIVDAVYLINYLFRSGAPPC